MSQLTSDKYYSEMSLDVEELENPARDMANKEVLELFQGWLPGSSFHSNMELLVRFRLLSDELKSSVRWQYYMARRAIREIVAAVPAGSYKFNISCQ